MGLIVGILVMLLLILNTVYWLLKLAADVRTTAWARAAASGLALLGNFATVATIVIFGIVGTSGI